MCGFIGEVNLETPQQSKVFDANLKLKNRGPDSQNRLHKMKIYNLTLVKIFQ